MKWLRIGKFTSPFWESTNLNFNPCLAPAPSPFQGVGKGCGAREEPEEGTIFFPLFCANLAKQDTLKQASASVNPDNQLLIKLGKISEEIKFIHSKFLILPLLTFLLKLSKKFLKIFFY